MKQNYKIEYYSSVEKRSVHWLWYPYIPYGKITIIEGVPGEGKSTLMIQLTALLTTGAKMPDGSGDGKVRNVIYQAAEDGLGDTVKPRLQKAGADCDKVAFLDLPDEIMNLDDARFEKAIVESKASLFVVDPMQAFMNCDSDGFKSGSLRSILTRVANVAERTKCAIVLIDHLNKKASVSKEIYRDLGSIDFSAVARSILQVERDSCHPDWRIITHIKSSLAPEGPGYVFGLDPEDGFRWLGESSYILNDAFEPSNHKKKTKKDRAKDAITKALIKRDLTAREMFFILKQEGVSKRTGNEAKSEMNITTYRKDNVWYWHLETGNK